MFEAVSKGPACCSADIEEFESFLHTELPVEYKNFLMQFNGCIPAYNCDSHHTPIDLPGGKTITVHQFYSLSNQCEPIRNLHEETENCIGFLPSTAFPFAHDSFGNVLCLECDSGNVHWILLEERYTLDYMRVFDLGVTFKVFLEGLQAGPYSE
ncbi:SMI1/KNR4 family protein SUKH-1 [Roseimicrobium gellanilyticum]|uniref:SMI1/KNR4 family protein SUKH-1 n=1 Tax=Roseimicrobium gellanilyticum TaxID=748857 RepID=A0A366HQX4_9BACT|nr:SMI1/KNR4 family protein SUKH-1 [Roseimicrobium gellanilyticum]